MPTSTGRAFTTANFLTDLATLKAINFGSADPKGVWFVVPNAATNNIEVWVWEPASVSAADETSVVRPDSVVPGSPGRCVQRLKFDASTLGGILAAIASLNTAGLIERTAQGGAQTVELSSFIKTLLDDTTSAAARTTLGLGSVNNTPDSSKVVAAAGVLTPGCYINGAFFNGSADININAGATLGTTSDTAFRGDYGNTAYNHSQITSGNPHGVTASMVGLGSVNNTSDLSKPISTLTQTALDLKAPLASPTFTGTVSGITAAMVGLGSVNNTSDLSKPISTLTQAALDLKAPLASPVFSGIATVPTAAAGTNTLQVANTAFVSSAIASLVNSSPAVLDTLGELAAALGNDPNFATTITTSIGLKAPLASPTFTGTPAVPTATAGTNTSQAASTAFVTTAVANAANSSYFVDLSSNNQEVSGSKFFTKSLNIGLTSNLTNNQYTNTDIKTLNAIYCLSAVGGSFTSSATIAPTFAFSNTDVEINSSNTNTFSGLCLGQQLRIRNFGTGTISILQGGRFTALNSAGSGNVTTQDGGYFLARNDGSNTVTTLSGGSFLASANSSGTVTNLNGGNFTANATAASNVTTVRAGYFSASSDNTVPATACIGIEIVNITGTAATKTPLKVGTGGSSYFNDTTASTSTTTGSCLFLGGIGIAGAGYFGGVVQATQFQIAGTKVLGARETGWTTGTGTALKGSYAADTATLIQVAQRVLALEQMARTHGLIN